VTFKSQILKFIFCSRQSHVNEVNNVVYFTFFDSMYIDSDARNSVSLTVLYFVAIIIYNLNIQPLLTCNSAATAAKDHFSSNLAMVA
jgi:hypothetical protein